MMKLIPSHLHHVKLRDYHCIKTIMLFLSSWICWYIAAYYTSVTKDSIPVTFTDMLPGLAMAFTMAFMVDCERTNEIGMPGFTTHIQSNALLSITSCRIVCGSLLFFYGFAVCVIRALGTYILPLVPESEQGSSVIPGIFLILHAGLMCATLYSFYIFINIHYKSTDTIRTQLELDATNANNNTTQQNSDAMQR